MIAWLLRIFRLSPKKKRNSTLKREALLLDIEPQSEVLDRYPYRTGPLTDHELWDRGWHDAIWNAKPNPKFINHPAYMRGWKESKG